ncbi:MAG: cupin domain-containing protein [Chloroflexi bacterium]|nr:cupin domain-containing protein [Chloroflexota bacterium]
MDSVIMHVDEARWLHKQDTPPGQPRPLGQRFIGDLETGPWIYVNNLEPGRVVPPHTHTQSETFYVVEGDITVGDRVCGPGTVVYMKAGTEYGFTVGQNGVSFVNIRTGLAQMAVDGATVDPWKGIGPA